ncbi:hypothetical protein LR48_Vigan03g059200 [Vigna angularis]|uniref:Uncharacterized protein n=1 Tax=Phaseolus angularis TaxID=3914 RepID=A0A0L9U361_PHAAN|nr:hypothetical protein LR48_Vigan03g059200 [Vigna angularis]
MKQREVRAEGGEYFRNSQLQLSTRQRTCHASSTTVDARSQSCSTFSTALLTDMLDGRPLPSGHVYSTTAERTFHYAPDSAPRATVWRPSGRRCLDDHDVKVYKSNLSISVLEQVRLGISCISSDRQDVSVG